MTSKLNIETMTIEEIVKQRDMCDVSSPEWDIYNEHKARKLEQTKPSTKETIVFFWEKDLDNIQEGFTATDTIPNIPYQFDRRSLLEYCDMQRHPIPYVIVRHKDHYFFILRGEGVGESRLSGKKGMLGGHVAIEDADNKALDEIIESAMKRELEEEAGITDKHIQSIQIKGLIKSNEGVDSDHLGVIYEVVLNTSKIQSEEEELTGIWIPKEEIKEHMDSFESWTKIVVNNIIM